MVEPTVLLGIDIGSSAVKAGIFGLDGTELAVSRVACSSAGAIDPALWWEAVCRAIAELPGPVPVAVGICGRGGTAVLLDEHGAILADSWEDGRALPLMPQVAAEHPGLAPQAVRILAKGEWWRRNRGQQPALALSAKDYAVYRLTGEVSADPASGGAPAGAGLPLASLRAPWERAGVSRKDGPLPPGIPVAVGWHDGAAATFGAGAAAEHVAPVTLGTTAVYRVTTSSIPAGLRKYWDLTPGLTVTGGDITGAGRAFAWATSMFPGADASRSKAGSAGLTFLPQFSGRIAPDVQRGARGTWWGLDGTQEPDDLLRSIVEASAFSLRQVRDWLATQGLRASGTVATGGGARNPLQAQVLSDVLGDAVDVCGFEEGCRGAALLGAVAAGFVDLEAARTLPVSAARYEPRATDAPAYQVALERFLAVQRATDTIRTGDGE
ncbi:MAG: FGGY-family carbohydrate kinase [Dehalococcoidia bacterium]